MSLSVGAPVAGELDDDLYTPEEPAAEAPVMEEPAQVADATVRAVLRGLSGGIGFVAGDADVPGHWRFTDAELDDLVPPLTRVINARPAWRAAVLRGDELTVGLVLAQYAGRNISDGRRAARARKDRVDAGFGPGAAANGASAGGGQPGGGSGRLHAGPDAGGLD